MSAAQHRHSTVTSDFILHFSLQPSSNITAVLLISKQLTWKLSMLQEQLSRHAALARLSVHLHDKRKWMSVFSLCKFDKNIPHVNESFHGVHTKDGVDTKWQKTPLTKTAERRDLSGEWTTLHLVINCFSPADAISYFTFYCFVTTTP